MEPTNYILELLGPEEDEEAQSVILWKNDRIFRRASAITVIYGRRKENEFCYLFAPVANIVPTSLKLSYNFVQICTIFSLFVIIN